MKYLLLLYGSEAARSKVPEAERARIFQEYMDYSAAIHRKGNYIAAEALQPTATARTVRQRNGKMLTTDGPFAETKEQLGGFYLVEAKDLDEAIQLAGGIPAVRTGSVEVRAIMPTPPVE